MSGPQCSLWPCHVAGLVAVARAPGCGGPCPVHGGRGQGSGVWWSLSVHGGCGQGSGCGGPCPVHGGCGQGSGCNGAQLAIPCLSIMPACSLVPLDWLSGSLTHTLRPGHNWPGSVTYGLCQSALPPPSGPRHTEVKGHITLVEPGPCMFLWSYGCLRLRRSTPRDVCSSACNLLSLLQSSNSVTCWCAWLDRSAHGVTCKIHICGNRPSGVYFWIVYFQFKFHQTILNAIFKLIKGLNNFTVLQVKTLKDINYKSS